MVRVEAPRVFVSIRLPQALRAAAAQSTPLCSQKRRSSLRTIAVTSAGDISDSCTQPRRRTALSTRSVWIGTPWRSSRVMSEGRCEALTSANDGRACAAKDAVASTSAASTLTPALSRKRERVQCSLAPVLRGEGGVRGRAQRAHGPTSIDAFGVSPKLSGAYIASTRVGGSANVPGLLRRTLYSTTCLPRGRYS